LLSGDTNYLVPYEKLMCFVIGRYELSRSLREAHVLCYRATRTVSFPARISCALLSGDTNYLVPYEKLMCFVIGRYEPSRSLREAHVLCYRATRTISFPTRSSCALLSGETNRLVTYEKLMCFVIGRHELSRSLREAHVLCYRATRTVSFPTRISCADNCPMKED
jgi:hypothetical protein